LDRLLRRRRGDRFSCRDLVPEPVAELHGLRDKKFEGISMSTKNSAATRRSIVVLAASAVLGVLSGLGASAPAHAQAAGAPVKIGIIGTGKIGGALARHWVKAGHEVFVSSRHPEVLQDLVKELGPKAHAGTPKQAAAFGEVILVSIPYGGMPQIGND